MTIDYNLDTNQEPWSLLLYAGPKPSILQSCVGMESIAGFKLPIVKPVQDFVASTVSLWHWRVANVEGDAIVQGDWNDIAWEFGQCLLAGQMLILYSFNMYAVGHLGDVGMYTDEEIVQAICQREKLLESGVLDQWKRDNPGYVFPVTSRGRVLRDDLCRDAWARVITDARIVTAYQMWLVCADLRVPREKDVDDPSIELRRPIHITIKDFIVSVTIEQAQAAWSRELKRLAAERERGLLYIQIQDPDAV